MTFAQLIENKIRNIFLQKLCRKWDRETSSKPLFFLKKKKMESFIRGKAKGSAV